MSAASIIALFSLFGNRTEHLHYHGHHEQYVSSLTGNLKLFMLNTDVATVKWKENLIFFFLSFTLFLRLYSIT